jgi:hypothetical protein
LLNSARSLSHLTTGLFAIGLGAAGAAAYFERRFRKLPPIVIESGPKRVGVAIGGRW